MVPYPYDLESGSTGSGKTPLENCLRHRDQLIFLSDMPQSRDSVQHHPANAEQYSEPFHA